MNHVAFAITNTNAVFPFRFVSAVAAEAFGAALEVLEAGGETVSFLEASRIATALCGSVSTNARDIAEANHMEREIMADAEERNAA